MASLAVGGAILSVLLVREIVQRRRSERAFERAGKALERVPHVDEEAHDELQLADLLDELARRAASSLRAAWAVVLLADVDPNRLRVAAATTAAPRELGAEIDAETFAERTARRHVVPLAVEGGYPGLLELGEADNHPFDRDDFALMGLVADRMASEIERARLSDAERRSRLGALQARAHVALIAEVSIVLARGIEDVRPTMQAVADTLVNEFADLCTIHLAGSDGRIERAADYLRPLGTDTIEQPTPRADGRAHRTATGDGERPVRAHVRRSR